MKKIITLLFLSFLSLGLYAQTDPILVIDGVNTTFKAGVSLPYWLKAGQTVALGANSLSVSAIEFKADSSQLKFNRAVIITSSVTVPSGMVWKLEAIGLALNSSTGSGGTALNYGPQLSNNGVLSLFQSPKEFTTPGLHNWVVPPGITNICVELWGAGGNGGTSTTTFQTRGGAGGGGGAYGYECLTVVPGTSYSLYVGTGGGDTAKGYSSFSNLFKAYAGKNASGGTPGVGGTVNTSFGLTGATGDVSPTGTTGVGGKGGDSPNGGFGGAAGTFGGVGGGGGGGLYPGGGGGGNFNGGQYNSSAAGGGANGKVVISW